MGSFDKVELEAKEVTPDLSDLSRWRLAKVFEQSFVVPELPGRVVGTVEEPYQIVTGANDNLSIRVDADVVATVVFPSGMDRTAAEVATSVTSLVGGVTAFDVDGSVSFNSNRTGSASSIEFLDVENNIYSTLGLTAGETFSGTGGDKYGLVTTFGMWFRPEIPEHESDTYFTVTAQTRYRMDLISQRYYGNTELDWAIMAANDILDPIQDITPGRVLRIPSLAGLYENTIR